MKGTEPNARQKSMQRAEVEGVVREAVFASLGIECVARIKSQLKRDISGFEDAARYLTRVLIAKSLAELNKPNYDEATLAAVSALPQH